MNKLIKTIQETSPYNLLVQRSIIDILIGDKSYYVAEGQSYGLPYLSGPKLCELSTQFGLPQTYSWGASGQKSRWEYMQDLMRFIIKNNQTSTFLEYLFQLKRFDHLQSLSSPDRIKEAYDSILHAVLDDINSILFLSGKELKRIHGSYLIIDCNSPDIIEIPEIDIINLSYVKALPDRIKMDLEKGDYDSVITKSRTLLEEVLIFIIEHKRGSTYESKGNLIDICKDCKQELGMIQHKEWDKRINEMLSGLEKIINSISSMRNIGSDSHGVGSTRIEVKEREAVLIANASMMCCEYYLQVSGITQ